MSHAPRNNGAPRPAIWPGKSDRSRGGHALPARSLVVGLALLVFGSAVTPAFCTDRPGKDAVKTAGDVLLLLLPAAGFGTALLKHDRRGQIQIIEALAVTAVVTSGLKLAIHKTRPDGNGNDSFPSGHTSITFSAATFLQKRYGLKYGLPAYFGATFVGFSRLYSDRHFFADVAAGAAIGFAASYFLSTAFDQVAVVPTTSSHSFGLHAAVQF